MDFSLVIAKGQGIVWYNHWLVINVTQTVCIKVC